VAVPNDAAATSPDASTVATAGAEDDQTPLVEVVAKSDVPDVHSWASPVIASGKGRTVATTDRVQPVKAVYTMVDVPGANPVSTPPLLMEAVNIAEEFHTPPGPEAERVDVAPWQTVRLPVIGPGPSSIVIFFVA
jgi:hypothetical protein